MTHSELPPLFSSVLAKHYVAGVYIDGQPAVSSIPDALDTLTHNGMPTVFMVHGWGADHRSFLPLVGVLNNCNVVLIDLPGFGGNRHTEDDHRQVCQHIASLLPPVSVLAGWSLGGMLLPFIASFAEQKGKTVCGMVSVAANTQFVKTPQAILSHDKKTLSDTGSVGGYQHAMDDGEYAAFVDAFTRTPDALLKRFYRTQVQGDAHARAVKTVLAQSAPRFGDLDDAPAQQQHRSWLQALLWLSRINHTADVKQSTLPTLHILGKHDALVPCAMARQFDNSQHHHTVILDDASHAPHISEPQKVAQHISVFLKHVLGVNQIDKTQLARSFGLAATHYHQAAFFQKDMAQALCERAGELKGTVVDLGCGTGFCGDRVVRRGDTISALIGLDISMGMLKQAREQLTNARADRDASANVLPTFTCADIEHLPFKPNSIDFFISNMSMQWCDNLSALFNGAYQSLKPGGQFSFTTLGPTSLYELKSAWQQADKAQGKATQHVNDFHSKAVVATHAKQAGFSVEYAQSRAHSVEYPSVKALLLDLKRVGAHNMSRSQTQGLMGKTHFSAMLHAYDAFKTPQSSYPLTYEMLFFTLKKP